MKKFKFSLEAILKLRKAKEDRVKRELGEIVKLITETKDRLIQLSQNLDQGYTSQEGLYAEGVASSRMLGFYPIYFEGVKADIKKNNQNLEQLQLKYEKKVQELSIAMGEVKVIEGLKEKQQTLWKKNRDKKVFEDLEELFLSQLHMNKKKAS